MRSLPSVRPQACRRECSVKCCSKGQPKRAPVGEAPPGAEVAKESAKTETSKTGGGEGEQR